MKPPPRNPEPPPGSAQTPPAAALLQRAFSASSASSLPLLPHDALRARTSEDRTAAARAMFRRAFSFDDAVHLGWLRDEPSESWTAGLGGPGEAELFASPKEKQRALAALERWVVREVVREQLSPWLSGAVEFGSDASSLEAMALRKLCECPLLSGSDAKLQDAMADLFRVVPRADALLQAVSKRGIEALLTGIIAGPLLSSLRAKRDPTAAPARPGLLPALLAARVLAEASQPRGAASLCEELKSAHSVEELRPSLRALVDAVEMSTAKSVFREVANEERRAKLAATFAQIPQAAILGVLRLHLGSSVVSALWSIATTSVAGTSLLQKLAATLSGLDVASQALDSARRRLPAPWIPFLESYAFSPSPSAAVAAAAAVADVATVAAPAAPPFSASAASPEEVRLRLRALWTDLDAAFAPQHPVQSESQAWLALHFVDALAKVKLGKGFVGLLGDPAVLAAMRQVFATGRQNVLGPLTAKSSGLVPLVRETFSCWKESLACTSLAQVQVLIRRVLEKALLLLKTVLLNDSGLVLHHCAFWLGQVWLRAAGAEAPDLDLLLQDLEPSVRREVQREALEALRREEFNLSRDAHTKKLPRPRLAASSALVQRFKASPVLAQVLAPVPRPRASELALTAAAMGATGGSVITHIEVSYLHESSDLAARGFSQCGQVGSAVLWARRAARGAAAPIRQVVLADAPLAPDGFVLIHRNLNKGAGAPCFLCFQRGPGEAGVKGLCVAATDREPQLAKQGFARHGVFRTGRWMFVTEMGLYVLE